MTLLLALLSPPGAAGEYFTTVSAATSFERAATWVRAFSRDDGDWWLLMGLGGDYGVSVLGADMSWDERELVALTGQTNLIDHGITRCPDGSYLHASSANLDQPNDSAYAFTYTADWQKLGGAAIEERQSGVAHNDMAILCGGGHRVVGFSAMGKGILHHIGEDALVTHKSEVDGIGFLTGGGMLADPDTGGVLLVTNGNRNHQLFVYELDADYQVLEKHTVDAAPEGYYAYWPQVLQRVGDHLLLGFMARIESEGWSQDTGNVWLAALDADLNVVERVQVSQHEAPEGAMRPWVARNGTTLLVTADRLVRPHLYTVELGAAAWGLSGTPVDTGLPAEDSGGGEDSGTGPDGDKGGGGGRCGGCASGPAGGLWAAALALSLGLARRR